MTSPYATTVDSAFLAYDPSGNARIATWVPSTSQTAYLDNSSGSWQSVAFGTTNDLGVQSMALDSHGYAHACYLAWITGSTYGLQYATNASGSWVISALGAVSGDEGCILTVDASDDVHVVVFSDTSLQYLNNVGGSWSALQTVDNTVTQLTYGEVDLQVDRNGHAHIGYVDEPNSLLRYATNATGAWATATVGSAQGYAVVLAVDATGAPHLLYADGTGLSYTAKVSSGWSSPTQVLSLGSSSAEYMTGAMDEQGYYHVAFCLLDSSGSAWGNSVYASNGSGVWTSTSLTGACNGGAPSVAVSPLGSTGVAYLDGSNLLVYQTFCQ